MLYMQNLKGHVQDRRSVRAAVPGHESRPVQYLGTYPGAAHGRSHPKLADGLMRPRCRLLQVPCRYLGTLLSLAEGAVTVKERGRPGTFQRLAQDPP
jgi:hypothetical protein